MSRLRDALEDYLALRRGLGFKLERPGQLLADFTGYLEAAGAPTVTTELALAWATAPAGADPSWWRRRLAAIRPFARYLAAFIPGTGVPPAGLMTAAAAIRTPLRAATYQTFIGLLAVTGMRAGEAIRLDQPDIDLPAGLVTVRESKFGNYAEGAVMPSPVTGIVVCGNSAQDCSA
jgi:integrase